MENNLVNYNLDIPFKEFMAGQIIDPVQFNDDMAEIEEKVNEIVGKHNSLNNSAREHIINKDNPHETTAHQVGTYTGEEIDGFVDDIKKGGLNPKSIKNEVLADNCVDSRTIANHTITASKVDSLFGGQIDISKNTDITDRYTKTEVDTLIKEKVGEGAYSKEEIDKKFQEVQAGQIVDKTIGVDKLKDDVGTLLDISANKSITDRYTKEEVDVLVRENGLPRDWGGLEEIVEKQHYGHLPVANVMTADEFIAPSTPVLDIDVREVVGARGGYDSLKDRLNSVDSQLEHNTEYINDISVNIKKYKSFNEDDIYWDGAMKEALKNNNNVFIPEGEYKFKECIQLSSFKNIKGANTNLGNGTKLIFDGDGFLISTNLRYITIENLQIYSSSNNGSGVRFGDLTSSARGTNHFIRIENCIIYGFNEGISISSNSDNSINETILWNCMFKNTRVEHCEKGLKCYDNPYSHFGIVFDCVYFNACNEVLYIRSMQGNFKGCNFGITNLNSFDIDRNSYISFNNCNFECDSFISGGGNLFNARAKNIDFDNIVFISRCSADTSFFGVFSSLEQLSFKNCKYSKHTEDLMEFFWSKSDCETARIGVVEFLGGTTSLPRPSWNGIYSSRFKDKNKDKMISYDLRNNNNRDHALNSVGEYAFNINNGLPIIHDGTNLTDFLGNTLGNDTNIHRLTNNLYIETGRITIPVGGGLITVNYKRQKKGIFITSPTGFINTTKKKYMISIEQSEDYFDKDKYCVLKAYEWDESNKTWSANISTSFTIDYIKVSN